MLNPDTLRRSLAAHPLYDLPDFPGRSNDRGAGVLVPVFLGAEPYTALTLRPSSMRRHAGEVSFPGGLPEEGDADLIATALREAHEEIDLTDATVLGRLSTFPLYTSSHRLHPFLAVAAPQPLVGQPSEVEQILRPSFAEILGAPHIDSIPFEWEGGLLQSPIFEFDGAVVFGATAHVLLEVAAVVGASMGVAVPPRKPGKWVWGASRPERA